MKSFEDAYLESKNIEQEVWILNQRIHKLKSFMAKQKELREKHEEIQLKKQH